MDLFEGAVGPVVQAWSHDLLSWWTRCVLHISSLSHCLIVLDNSKVFGAHSVRIAAGSRAGSSVAKLASQRAARELAQASAS